MTTTTMATTTRAPVPGRRLLAAVGIWTGVATAAGVATFLAARAIAPRWATAANLGTVIAAEVSTALVVVLLVVSNQPLGWRIPRRQDLAWGWRPPPPPGGGRGGLPGAVAAARLARRPGRSAGLHRFRRRAAGRGRAGPGRGVGGPRGGHHPAGRGVGVPGGAVWAVAFAGIHGFLVVMPYALVFGVVAGWLRERTGAVAAGVVTHVLQLAVLVTVTFLVTG
jgi:hypothetical protein